MGMGSMMGGAAILYILMMALTFIFFGAMCFVADDMRALLKTIADNAVRRKDQPLD